MCELPKDALKKPLRLYAQVLVAILVLTGCTTPATYLKENVTEKINLAYSLDSVVDTKNCLKQTWATRDVHAWVRTFQFEPLIETEFDEYIQLSYYTQVIFQISAVGSETEIRESHEIDIDPVTKGVVKDVMLKCSSRQTFRNLTNANENIRSE